jgi:coproporphyrinogen III oxidase-like Fe-S oxidoreductase
MSLTSPILNYVFRKEMSAFLRPESVEEEVFQFSAPPSHDDYLLYIHIPFCESLCPYCSFHRCEYSARQTESYFQALYNEIDLYREHGFQFRSVYIGGGTPTIRMDLLMQLLGKITNAFPLREISVETNPNHLSKDHLDRMKDGGVNRLSVGVQSFDDDILHHIGRLEKYGSGHTIQKLLEKASGILETLNVDLIFNIPIQTDESLNHDLKVIHSLQPDQVTFYPLMTAPSVEKTLNQMLGRMDYRNEERQYLHIVNQMCETYNQSTAWCFSRSSGSIDEYIIDHDEYVGVGSGSFGFFNNTLHINTFSNATYIQKLKQRELPVSHVKQFTPKELQYYCMLRRLFALKTPARQLISELDALGPGHLSWLFQILTWGGALKKQQDFFHLTRKGQYIWIMAMREFFIAVDTLRDQFRNQAQGGATNQNNLSIKTLLP